MVPPCEGPRLYFRLDLPDRVFLRDSGFVQQGIQRDRRLLLRQIRKRFDETTAEQSAPLLDQIADGEKLEDLGEAIIDAVDKAAWLQALRTAVG